ncbi:venom serine carboxypeptidase-like [Colias croceus]|uniref:venom serine carboxypeptidase-like n=1 Tax=Colias crocea TaxID=72248 RepID=UPI001E280C83|nr:venom serine carboxypeptidase-like [Colias croceus]
MKKKMCTMLHILFILCATVHPILTATPLILTPFVNQNNTEEARNRSAVDPKIFLDVRSYSGFLTVDEKHNSNQFFWYFPTINNDGRDMPWILWLQGGLGLTSMAGLFNEIGPFEYIVNDTRLSRGGYLKDREHSWNKKFSMVFMDNSVAEGYSHTNKDLSGIPADEEMYASNLLSAVQQLVQIYPELSKAPLYIAGDKFTGHYAPALAMKIMETNSTISINLKGIILGNPILNGDSVADYSSTFYNFGLIDRQGVLAAKPLQDKFIKSLGDGIASNAYSFREDLLKRLKEMSGKRQLYNAIKDYVNLDYNFYDYITKADVREALHVGDLMFSINDYSVITNMRRDFLNNVTAKLEKLLENYRVLIYCGQFDLEGPCVPNAEARRKWQWKKREDFLKAPHLPWWFNDSMAGYIKSGGNLMEVLITDTGSLVPIDRPAELFHLISNFIDNKEFNFVLPPDYVINENYTAPYVEETKIEPNDEHVKLTISLIVNIVLILLLLLGIVLFLRFKKKIKQLYGPVSEGAMNMR